MLTEVKVENYKSLKSLSLPLGRINVLIGENGSGKSNILEAIALGAAALDKKLDNEFLYSRGIRVTQDPIFMRAAFDSFDLEKDISLSFKASKSTDFGTLLTNYNKPYSRWNVSEHVPTTNVNDRIKALIESGDISPEKITRSLIRSIAKDVQSALEFRSSSGLQEFLIYSPENSVLRGSEREGQIQPLGIKGEGLFRYLRYLSSLENSKMLDDIKHGMRCLEWFQDFAMSEELPDGDVRISIKDQYIPQEVGEIDQLSTNEGFLFILFYFCLLVGKETPSFFAIDNIDTSLNPKLCTRLMKEIVGLAKRYGKQLILTTHNPAILDGLNLDDDEQRLFAVRRNTHGQTIVKRIMKPKVEQGEEPVRLSEAFLRGYIGGLPRNF
jgi:predicted ATPase